MMSAVGRVSSAPSTPRTAEANSVSRSSRREVSDALSQEQAAKRRLAQLQRRLLGMRATHAVQRRHLQNGLAAAAVRAETDRRSGKELKAKFAGVRAAREEQVVELSTKLNEQMVRIIADPMARQWFKLFRHMDDDDSGRISYAELAGMIREELKMDSDELPEAQLRSLWKALDRDLGGYITPGEFGAFMRKGVGKSEPWRDRVRAKNQCEAAAVRAETDRRSGKELKAKFAHIKVADEAQVVALSERLNDQMAHIIADPHARQWYKLFRHMDDDDSGRISYRAPPLAPPHTPHPRPPIPHLGPACRAAELVNMLREELRLDADEMPESTLRSLWKALDRDLGGWISAGEFGAFMRKG